jgi:2-iminoacetate synthase
MTNNSPRLKDLFHPTFSDLATILHTDSRDLLENLAYASREVSRRYFGYTISLYAPLYISNYCENDCTYCGFQAHADIARKKLTLDDIKDECLTLYEKGIRSILILTGESRKHSPVSYIREAVVIAKSFFPNIALEVYPLETEEYHDLFVSGVDGVTLYQETYNRHRYAEVHPAGRKRDYDYRYNAPERMAKAGIRHISLGVLLGLSDWREDVPSLFDHLRRLEKKYPGVEYSLSFPRLQKIPHDDHQYFKISDADMLKLICTARLLFPRVGINLSTRESAAFRDRVFEFGVTRMSAGSSTKVGGYIHQEIDERNGQFHVNDTRSLDEIKTMLAGRGFDPVITDWRNISNE